MLFGEIDERNRDGNGDGDRDGDRDRDMMCT